MHEEAAAGVVAEDPVLAPDPALAPAKVTIPNQDVVTGRTLNVPPPHSQPAPNCLREKAVNGEAVTMRTVLSWRHRHRHRAAASGQTRNATPTLNRRAISSRPERAVNGGSARYEVSMMCSDGLCARS